MPGLLSRFSFLVLALLAATDALSERPGGNEVFLPSPQPPINIIVVGGSSGMGKAAAIACVKRGGKALIVSRSEEKLARAAEEIQSYAPQRDTSCEDSDDESTASMVTTAVLDASDEEAVELFSKTLPSVMGDETWDGLVISAAGSAPHGAMEELETSKTRDLFESKFWSAYHCAKYIGPKLSEGSGVVFVAGVLNRRPGKNCVPLASTNGALEGLTRSLALEWGPRLRVNCLSPGFCDTERFDRMDPERKEAMLANTADSLPLKRTGVPEDMGEGIYYLLTAGFCTGVVLDVDGGHGIRQYANAQSDPMRQSVGTKL
ncbi:unnamed protein product [Pseudo-nitzschia multistriata]|uniref:Uncharacterized protein n=1 Tax=Pseudo-nitzschia multistriata TaxID=183589 RepID=A0A448ZFF2_9STRA|nr:unnamed protein product [Pseudo-nitzschia multistriata]